MDVLTAFLIAAGVLTLVSLILLCLYNQTRRLLDEMWAVDTYDSRELARMCSDGFDATVEVEGTVSCEQPIVSLAAEVECVWFRTRVEREDRRTRTVRDSRTGHTRTETYYTWVTDMDVTHTTVFKVHDQMGFTLVDPEGADIDSEIVCSRITLMREPWFEGVMLSDTGRYRVNEEAFLPEGYAYVLGRATSTPKGVLIHHPDEGYADSKARFFIISRKTEKELTRHKQRTQSVLFWLAVTAFLGAIYCALVGFRLVTPPV